MDVLSLDRIKSVHIIGVCGTLMGAFAAFLKRQNIHVTGSDQNVYPPMSDVLKKAGVELFNGYRAENLTQLKTRPDLVVIGNVIRSDNAEARAAIDGGYAYSSLPESMETIILRKTRNLVVAGTHGKTTTSSMLAHALISCGKDPGYFIGGVSQDLPYSFHVASTDAGRYFVLEGDEYDTAFWDKVPKFFHYLPDEAILTSVEFDHADIYPNLDAVIRAFEGLMTRIRPGGKLIACMDYAPIRQLIRGRAFTVTTYGSDASQGAEYFPTNVRSQDGIVSFGISKGKSTVGELSLQVPGNHNVLNALAVWIQCRQLGLAHEDIAQALRAFKGVKRRQEVRGEKRGILVIDDFAHHPTAVRETLRALKQKYPKRRLIAVFEPRSATSRRKVFQKDYVSAFCEGDATFIATPYDQSRISVEEQFSSDQLVQDLSKKGRRAFLMASVEEGADRIARYAKPGDCIAVLSNGSFGGLIPKLLEMLEKAPAEASV